MNNGIDLQTPDKAKIEEIIKIEWQMFQNVDNLGRPCRLSGRF